MWLDNSVEHTLMPLKKLMVKDRDINEAPVGGVSSNPFATFLKVRNHSIVVFCKLTLPRASCCWWLSMCVHMSIQRVRHVRARVRVRVSYWCCGRRKRERGRSRETSPACTTNPNSHQRNSLKPSLGMACSAKHRAVCMRQGCTQRAAGSSPNAGL